MSRSTRLLSIAASELGGQQVPTVNARDLHAFLEVGKDFSNWVKAQIERARLVDGRDYLVAQKGEQLPSGTKYRTDYHLTIDAAKHVAMMSGTEKGFEVRDYFIECERQARQPAINPAMLTRADLARLVLEAEAEVQQLNQVIAVQAPKVDALQRIAQADGSFCLRDAAKALQVRPIDLRNLLITERWIYGRPGHLGWLAYQDRIQTGLMLHKVRTVQRQDGTDKVVEQPRITAKGLARLGELLMRKAA